MFTFVITRETRFAYDTKIVLDKRDLVEDIDTSSEMAELGGIYGPDNINW